jgi:hypothetical protein
MCAGWSTWPHPAQNRPPLISLARAPHAKGAWSGGGEKWAPPRIAWCPSGGLPARGGGWRWAEILGRPSNPPVTAWSGPTSLGKGEHLHDLPGRAGAPAGEAGAARESPTVVMNWGGVEMGCTMCLPHAGDVATPRIGPAVGTWPCGPRCPFTSADLVWSDPRRAGRPALP